MYALNLRAASKGRRSSGVSTETYRSGLEDMAAEANDLIGQIRELKQRVQQVQQYLDEDIGSLNFTNPASPDIADLEELRDNASNILAFFGSF